jgi:hypothetical protein
MNSFWKRFDLYGQLTMLLIPLLLGGILSPGFSFSAYFSVGAWQVMSTLIHKCLSKKPLTISTRAIYEWVLAALAIVGLLSIAFDGLFIFYLYLMLLAGVVMGIWYFIITLIELRIEQARAFVHLK